MSNGDFNELQMKINNIYLEGLISNDDLEHLTLLNRFINLESKKKYSISHNNHKVIKPKRFPTVENSKFWKISQDRLEEERMAV
jgi:hypothetical protein